MKVISIGSDRNLFVDGSSVRKRILNQARLFEELHIIIFSRRRHKLQQKKIAQNVWLYPTNSWSRFTSIGGATALGKRIISGMFSIEGTIITCQDPFEAGLVGKKLARDFGIPLQLQIHTDFLSPEFVQHSVLNRVRVVFAGSTLPVADCIRVVSKRIKNSLTKYQLQGEPVVLPVYVNKNYLQEEVPAFQKPFPFTILMYSRLSKEKDIGLALQAFAQIHTKFRDAGMLLLGDGPEKAPLQRLVAKLGIADKVVFLGWKEEYRQYLRAADVFLNTSRYEGYGRTLVEAALMHCPIITTNVGVVGDVITDATALICPIGDVVCVAQQLQNCIEHRDERVQKAHRAYRHATAHVLDEEVYLEHLRNSFNVCKNNEAKRNTS